MDDGIIISFLHAAFNLVKHLESNLLPNHNINPHLISYSCDQIISLFTAARELLNTTTPPPPPPPPASTLLSLQEWLTSISSSSSSFHNHLLQPSQLTNTSSSTSPLLHHLTIHHNDHHPANSPIAASSSLTLPTRKDNAQKRSTVRVAAPQIGNTEIPPEDGFTWRKYGQKLILGSRFPRSYYRCTHQKLYKCPAKRQVQRLDNDPFTFEVTYLGSHTCHMSATAPSSIPPTPPAGPTTSLSGCLEFSLGGASSSS